MTDSKNIIDNIIKTVAIDKEAAVKTISQYIGDMKKRTIVSQAFAELCEIVGNIPQGSTIDQIKLAQAQAMVQKMHGDNAMIASQYDALKKQVNELTKQTGYRSIFVETFSTGFGEVRALLNTGGTREEVKISPEINVSDLYPGHEVLVTIVDKGIKCIAETRGYTYSLGRTAKVKKVVDKEIYIDEPGTGADIILTLSGNIDEVSEGDSVRYEPQTRFAFEVIDTKENVSEYMASDLNPFRFKDIGGLNEEIEMIKERIIYPMSYPDVFKKYGINQTRGVLLSGPPGSGKSMLACAIFNEISDMLGQKDIDVSDHFFIVKSSQVLSKWVGNSEQAVRDVFSRARDVSKGSRVPSIIFWDEIEAVMRARNESASYSASATLVPTLLTELNGASESGNVIFIAASNRPDLIDSALLRAGRLGDCKIVIKRPDEAGAKKILELNIDGKPVVDGQTPDEIVAAIVEFIYKANPIAKINFETGEYRDVGYKEIVNGATLAKIINDSLLHACMGEIKGKPSGLSKELAISLAKKEFDNSLSLMRPHNIADFIDLPPELLGVRSKIVTQS